MALLDNEGFKILDAVLTDLGRKKLAEGNGNLPIRKYAFGDDEINYGLFDVNNPESSVATVLLTPLHEAFTDVNSALKYKLIGNLDKTLAYLPIFQVNTSSNNEWGKAATSTGSFNVLSNVYASQDTNNVYHSSLDGPTLTGIIDGFSSEKAKSDLIHVDQGINSTAKGSQGSKISDDLVESRFFVKIDSKFGRLVTPSGEYADSNIVGNGASSNYIATYLFSTQDDSMFSKTPPPKGLTAILGPGGPQFRFTIGASNFLLDNTSYMFSTYGSQYASDASFTYHKIESSVEISGYTFGSYLSIPVTYVAAIPA